MREGAANEIRTGSRFDGPGWLLLSPAFLWLLLLSLAPIIMMVVYSFARRGDSGEVILSLDGGHYRTILDPLYLRILTRSVVLAGATTLICLLLAYPAAYWIARKAAERWKPWLILLAVLPFWTSFLIRTYAWIGLLRTEGVVNQALNALHIPGAPLDLLYSNIAVLLGLVYGELPFMILPLYVVLERLDERLLEAARDLGATSWQAFLRITLPLSAPGVMAGVVFVFIPSIGAYLTPDLLGGAKSIMIGNVIQNQFIQRNAPLGATLSLVLTAISLVLTWLALRAGARREAV
ncbi:MAG: ABC transporter permease [Acidobacteria bacterium]|nr:ABC transporter permease [Acidobacteriota bacterium]